MNHSALPRVSIIIPTRNNARTIEACLVSCARQTAAVEIVVVDRGSTDGTLEIARRHAAIVVEAGPERSAQRNEGARLAHGEFVAIIDSDMVLAPKVIEACLAAMNDSEAVGVVIPEESFGQGYWAQCKSLERSFYRGVAWMEAARFFRRVDFLAEGGYDETLVSGEDWDLSQRMARRGRLARVDVVIRHDEGRLSLAGLLRKKAYYGRAFSAYARKQESAENFSRQVGVVGRFRLFFSDPRRLAARPLVGLGMLVMKAAEFAAGAWGYALGRLSLAPPRPEHRKQVLILDCFLYNTGDLAILLAMVTSLRAVVPDAEITIETHSPSELAVMPELAGCRFVPRVLDRRPPHGPAGRVAYVARGVADLLSLGAWGAARSFGLRLDWIVCRRARPLMAAIRDADLVLSCGGGFLMTYYPAWHALLKAYVHRVCMWVGKPVALYAQSVGPFDGRFVRWIFRRMLNRYAWISIREPVSFDYVRAFAPRAKVRMNADEAFLLKPRDAAWIGTALSGSAEPVAFCVQSHWDPSFHANARAAFIAAIRHSSDAGFDPIVVSHQRSTDKLATDIHREAGLSGQPVLSGLPPAEVKALYGRCRLLVSGLMHAVILASEQGVPFVALSYQPKFIGLMRMLSYDERLVIPEEAATSKGLPERLIAAIDLAISEKAGLSTRLLAVMPEIRAAARRNAEAVKSALL